MKELDSEQLEKADDEKKVFTLIVNARKKEWHENHITFREVVVLAFKQYEDNPQIEYTVAYSNGPRPSPQGSMVEGDKVKVDDRMNFNVTRTDKS
ncbi:MAG: multiubiquitin domain-containing protein [Pyrinomonadaceae bacterium]